MGKSKGILLAVGVVVVVGIAYFAFDSGVGPDEAVQGTIAPAERHQRAKTQYYAELLERQQAETLGQIAAKFERAPAEAETMLQEHGWSKKEFDEMVDKIRSDEELNQMFQVAKTKASQQ